MIHWESINYSIDNAEKDYENLSVKTNRIEPIILNDEFTKLRERLIKARDNLYNEYGFDQYNRLDYKFDLLFALELYEILNNEFGFQNRTASNLEIWTYLSIKVIPDIVHARWGLNAEHFYKRANRIWLKTLWWYIHLSWRNNKEETYEILKDNSTDTILQLVERPSLGYYIDLFREIMYQYYIEGSNDRDLFRRVLKLNTARIMSITPEFVEGGIQQYVRELFNDAKK